MLSMGRGERLLNFSRLLLSALTLHFVRVRCAGGGCSFFAARQRTNQENAPRDLESLGTLDRVFVGAALPLRATRREDIKFQRLRVRVKKTRTHHRARLLKNSKNFLPRSEGGLF